jgi:hypothetical protein
LSHCLVTRIIAPLSISVNLTFRCNKIEDLIQGCISIVFLLEYGGAWVYNAALSDTASPVPAVGSKLSADKTRGFSISCYPK